MFPIKATVVFKEEAQVKEWRARFNVPIYAMVKYLAIPNTSMVTKVLEKEVQFKTKMYRLPEHKTQGSCTFDIENITQLHILELYMMIYNSQLITLYKEHNKSWDLKKYHLEPQSILTGITHTRRLISILTQAHSSSLSQAVYSVQKFTPFINLKVGYRVNELIPNKVAKLINNHSIEMYHPEPAIELSFWPYDGNFKITHAAVAGHVFDYASLEERAYQFIAEQQEKKAMNLLMRQPLKSYNHGEISYDDLNAFLALCSKEEPDFIITTIVPPTRTAKLEILSMPFEDSSVIIVYEDRRHGLKVFYLITVSYNIEPDQVTNMLESLKPQLYNVTLSCHNVFELQVLQLRIAHWLNVNQKSKARPYISNIIKHIHTVLGIKSVWGTSSTPDPSSGHLGEVIDVSTTCGPGYFTAKYEILDVVKDVVTDLETIAKSEIPSNLIAYLKPELRTIFINTPIKPTKILVSKI